MAITSLFLGLRAQLDRTSFPDICPISRDRQNDALCAILIEIQLNQESIMIDMGPECQDHSG